jgi:predicted MFS family arabinose efflux permease
MRLARLPARIKESLHTAMGIDFLSRSFISFFVVHCGFLLATNAISPFANTLFFRLTGKLSIVVLFHGITSILTPIGTIASIFFLKRHNFIKNIKVSFSILIVLYIAFIYMMYSKKISLLPVVATLNAFSNGFYWINYSLFMANISNRQRDKAIALIGIASGGATIIMPLISGAVISLFPGLWGYAIVVLFATVISIISLFWANKISIDHKLSSSSFRHAGRLMFNDKAWVTSSFCELCKGIRDGPFPFIASILLFTMVQKEYIVSTNTFAVGVVTIISSSVFGRLQNSNTIKLMLYAVHCLVLTSVGVLLKGNMVTITLLSLINAFLSLYILNPPMDLFYTLANRDKNCRKHTAELYAIRGCFLAIGKALGLGCILIFAEQKNGVPIAIFCVTLVQYLTWALCKRQATALKDAKPE